jgi:bile acid acyltransferase/acyl-CoA thioester hydrolase-like protein
VVVKLITSYQDELWCDPPPVVHGEGFVPVTEVRVACSCHDGAGQAWRSENGFLVSAQSTFDTGSTAGFGDDYYGVAAEGPIYSMRCLAGIHHNFVLPEDGEIEFTFKLLDGRKSVWTDSTTRRSFSKKRNSLDQVVFFLYNDSSAARYGKDMLSGLGYTVEGRAVSPEQPDLDSLLNELLSAGRVHLVSSGRASEAALELAQRTPELESVSAFSGSGLRFTPWRIEGQELSHAVCDHSTLQPRGQTVLSFREVYAEAVANRENRDLGRIEVEKINCPIYLFTGSDDQIWPSAAFSELIAQRRTAHGLEEQTYHRTFPSVGHDLGPELGLPGLPTTERTTTYTTKGFRLALGGKMGRQSRARRECWESLLEILQGRTPGEFKRRSTTGY